LAKGTEGAVSRLPSAHQSEDSNCAARAVTKAGITRRRLLSSALSLAGAACANQTSERVNNILRLQIGMSREEVISLMGQPERQEIHAGVEFLIYQTDTRQEEGWNLTPVGLVDGRVTGWGRVYYEAAKGSRTRPDGGMSSKNAH
jgi:hypothetical protein